jgi:hypothetical protein
MDGENGPCFRHEHALGASLRNAAKTEKTMANPITEHLNEVDESYGEHLVAASGFGLRMMAAGFLCFLHGILPFLFKRTASDTVSALHDEMVIKRRKAYDEHWVI